MGGNQEQLEEQGARTEGLRGPNAWTGWMYHTLEHLSIATGMLSQMEAMGKIAESTLAVKHNEDWRADGKLI